jgi:hypothetical protein
MDLLHEQYEDKQGHLVLFECTECGYISLSLGALHGHIEGHESFVSHLLRFLPFVGPDYTGPLMDRTRIKRVDTTLEIELDDVEGL